MFWARKSMGQKLFDALQWSNFWGTHATPMQWHIARKNKMSNANTSTCFDGGSLDVVWLLVSVAMSSMSESGKCITTVKEGDGSREISDCHPMTVVIVNSSLWKFDRLLMSHTNLCVSSGALPFFTCLICGSRRLWGHVIVWHCLLCFGFSLTACFNWLVMQKVIPSSCYFFPTQNCAWSGAWQKHGAKCHTRTAHWLDCSLDWSSESSSFVILCLQEQCHKEVTLCWHGELCSDSASCLAKNAKPQFLMIVTQMVGCWSHIFFTCSCRNGEIRLA